MQSQTPSVNSTCHASVWDPYLAKERTLLEAVQKFACKVCCKNWNMDYESMLGHLNIPKLQKRRLQLKAMFYSFIPPPTMTHVIVFISQFRMLY